jgi:beta-galactosidase
MGANAIRCSHNPMAPEFYDLCDRLGLLVMDEAFDEWTLMKPQIRHGYSKYFAEWFERDLVAQLRQNRNHPSIVMWSVGNEIGEQTDSKGAEVLKPLVDLCHREDPTRPVTAALDRAFTDEGPAPRAFTDLLDIVGYNYVDRWLDRRETYFGPDRSAYPQRRFVGTEDTGLGGVRGSYVFRAIPAGTPERALYAATPIRVEQLWKFALTHGYDIGHFMWTGIDYLGESRWPGKAASSGALDTCGFPKDSYYLFQSLFTEKPVLHLLPHWNWAGREGQIIPVLAYTNCDVVELTLNGRSLGAKAHEFPRQGTKGGWNTYAKPQVAATTADLHLAWDVPYEPGVLKAVGWKNGQKVCEAEVRTAGAPAALVATADRTELRADGRDVAHVTVKVVDANSNAVPGAAQLLKFSVDGAARLLGVDNGDPASHESFQGPERHAFDGLCLALIQTNTTAGEIRVSVSADGLSAATVTLTSTAVKR